MNTPSSTIEGSGRHLLGVRFDAITLPQARAYAAEALQSAGQKKIFTPNPEMLVKAQKDTYFKTVLNRADLALCDGRGTELMLRYLYPRDRVERITGADFTLELCALSEACGKRVFLLGGGREHIVQQAAQTLTTRFPGLVIAGVDAGPDLVEDPSSGRLIEPESNSALVEKIRMSAPDVLLVAFGMGKQEKWIHVHVGELPSVKIAMGVGGTFDFLAGNIPRAPKFMRRIGLEWLYRLAQEPGRISRIWRATAVFSWLIARERYEKSNSF